jgi:flagellar secretion chaperone FliS
MGAPTNSQYLESRVLTAPPPRLHLMLVEGALRFGRKAEEALQQGEVVAAATQLLRVVDIVGELLAGVRESKEPLNQQIAELYWFIFRRVSAAKINSDAKALAEALRLLEIERQTWQMVCEKFGGGSSSTAGPRANAIRAAATPEPTSRFSLEA